MKVLIALTFFDSQKILEKYFHKDFDQKEIKKYLFIEARNKDIYKPDYIFKNVIDDFIKNEDINSVLIDSLEELSDMLIFREQCVYIKNEYFEKWQNSILSVSPMLIIAYLIFKQTKKSFYQKEEELIKNIFKKTALPSIYEPQVSDIIKHKKLNEMHMHLNGSTEIDVVWQDAINQNIKFYNEIKKSFQNVDVSEQYLQISDFEQQDLYRLIKIASQIRDKLLSIIFNEDSRNKEYFNKNTFNIGRALSYTSKIHPIKDIERKIYLNSAMQYEALFFIRCFDYLTCKKNTYFGKLFHYYMLIYSFFQKLLVQQKTQVGFDQFQKITFNETRELTEKKYEARYNQLQGMYFDSLDVLEGRFAPKDDFKKSLSLLKSISNGYTDKHQKKFKLKLVSHFIKNKDTRKIENIITFRDLNLRIKNQKSLAILLESMKYRNNKTNIEYKNLIVGFDAAANELHASPEAFAPIFRKLYFLGYSNFTYHAGEDFIHILSGLRMIYEAIDFLEMQSGNRIGHGTAMGIEPELWEQRLYDSKLTIRKGEWLDNLVFAYMLCSNNYILVDMLNKIDTEIRKYFNQIYGNTYYSMNQLIEAWKCRKYDPLIVFNWRKPSFFDTFENDELNEYNNIDKNVHILYEKYHTKEYIENYNKMIQIEPLEIFDCKSLRILQNCMIDFLNSKNIAVETLPTSNVRISYYKNYKEHHLSRWLGLDDKQDSRPNVVIGSDDTGIFSTNLQNEYLHIYKVLCERLNEDEALEKITYLISTSKAYTFN